MQLHSGVVKKVLTNEGFGFIETASQGDLFFHKSESAAFTSLKQDDLVSFSVKTTQKGNSAQNIQIVEMAKLKRMVKTTLFTKDKNPKRGFIVQSESVETNWFSNPNDAREALKSMASSSGCNAILQAQLSRGSIQKGYNYFGTGHSYSASIAIVVEEVMVEREARAELQLQANAELYRCCELASKEADYRQKLRDRKPEGSGVGLFFFLTFVVFCASTFVVWSV